MLVLVCKLVGYDTKILGIRFSLDENLTFISPSRLVFFEISHSRLAVKTKLDTPSLLFYKSILTSVDVDNVHRLVY